MVFISSVMGCHAAAPAPQCPPASPAATTTLSPQVALTNPPIPYDLPRTEDFAGLQMVFFVDVSTDGTISAEGNVMDSDETFRTSAKRALQSEPNVRAVIRADGLVQWKYIIHAMDVLKQSGISKIAFGVSASSSSETNTTSTKSTATLEPGAFWDCPFPKEADAARIDEGIVTLVVVVDRNDKPERVELLNDPGHGFGQSATACAMKMKYRAPRDDKGQPILGKTPPIRIRFTR